MNIEKMEESRKFINSFLEIFGVEDGPVDFQIMKFNRNNDDIFKEIMTNEKFLKLEDENILKQTLLKFQRESETFLKDLYSKVEKI